MKAQKIWSSVIEKIEDWVDDDGAQMSYEEAELLNSIYLDDERTNLDIATEGEIICIADVGRWNGRRHGYKLLGHKVSNILQSHSGGDVSFEYTKLNVRGTETHHDGTNTYLFRELKGNTHDEQVENAYKLFSGDLSPSRISYYTKSIAPYVTEVYGW